jgi:hypothetical protein
MQRTYHIFDKLLTLFKKSKTDESLNSVKQVGRVSFILDDTNNINIECTLPNVDNIHDVSNLAENYANLLSSITFGELNDALYEHIKKLPDTSNDNQLLFINNVLSFWSILYKQKQQGNVAKIKNKYIPLIRPSQAFKT